MFDIWHVSDKLKNPVMVGEYIANKLNEAINYTHCCETFDCGDNRVLGVARCKQQCDECKEIYE